MPSSPQQCWVCKRLCWLLSSLDGVSQVTSSHVVSQEWDFLSAPGDALPAIPLVQHRGHGLQACAGCGFCPGAFLPRAAADTCLFGVYVEWPGACSHLLLTHHLFLFLLGLYLIILGFLVNSCLLFHFSLSFGFMFSFLISGRENWYLAGKRPGRNWKWCLYGPVGGEFSSSKEPGGDEW